MDPAGGSSAHLNEHPIASMRLGKDGDSIREHRQYGCTRRGTRPQIDTGCANDPNVLGTVYEIGFVDDRLGDTARAINKEERCTESAFLDLTFGLFEFLPRTSDLGGSPRCGGLGPFDLDPRHRDRRDGICSGVCTSKSRLYLDERSFRRFQVSLKSRDLLYEVGRAFGFRLSKELCLFGTRRPVRALKETESPRKTMSARIARGTTANGERENADRESESK